MFKIEMSVRGLLSAARWRSDRQLAAMSAEDQRNTLIVELGLITNLDVSKLQARKNEQLVEIGAIALYLREAGFYPPAKLKAMSEAEQKQRLAALVGAYAGRALNELLRLGASDLVKLGLPWLGRVDPACEGSLSDPLETSPVVDGEQVYFVGGTQRSALYRRGKGDANPDVKAVRLADHCTGTPCVDGEWVYYRDDKNALMRCNKNQKLPPERLASPCYGSPHVRDRYLYFRGGKSQTSLSRLALDGGGRHIEPVCDDCHGSPFVDGGYVYYTGGPDGNALRRCEVSGTKAPETIDDCCAGRPFVDGDYLYFAGSRDRDQLFKRRKDGKERARFLDDRLRGSPFVSGRYVYFMGGGKRDALFRRATSGDGEAECIYEGCAGSPFVDGQHVYFAAAPEGTKPALFRRRCDDDFAEFARHKEWMKDSWDSVKDRPLWQIAMVGAHDAGSYGRWWDGVAKYAVTAEKRGSKTQGASLARQLEFGVRYFDLRFHPPANDRLKINRWYINHGSDISTVTLEEVIADIADFVNQTSREILIIDASSDRMDVTPHGTRASVVEQAHVLDAFVERIGPEHFVTRRQVRDDLKQEWPASCTPEELTRGGVKSKVVLLWSCPHNLEVETAPSSTAGHVVRKDYCWTTETPSTTGGSPHDELCQITRHGEDVAAQMDWWRTEGSRIQRESRGRYFWRPSFPGSAGTYPREKADKALPSLIDHLRSDWRPYPWNLLNVDLFTNDQYADFVDAVVRLNTFEGRFKYR